MDDPWGSPWAADSPAKVDLPTVPQSARVASSDYLNAPRRASPGRSPWTDDEAWGSGGWNDVAVGGGSGKESPGWAGRSPGLRPLRGSPLARHSSPDPWRGLSLGALDTAELMKSGVDGRGRGRRNSERSRDGRKVVDSAISLGEVETFQRDESMKDDISVLEPPLGIGINAWGAESTEPRRSEEETSDQLERPRPAESQAGQVLDDEHAVDKDPQLPEVQKLADMTHELARRKSVAEERLEEEEETDVPELEPDHVPHIVQDDAALVEDTKSTVETNLEDLGLNVEAAEAGRPIAHASKPPPIPFPIDFTNLDDLFPSTEPVTTEPEPVPDAIIDDTFASNGERRAWYRISRFGSLRKHDSGDNENYVRVTWVGSEVRERTTKIVRRWMEEDSIAGRVVLGRRLGASGATMFNWDSAAPAVGIGELLGRHSRQTSLNVTSPVVSPTAVSFGWVGSLPSTPTVIKHPLATELQQNDSPSAESTPRQSDGTPRQLESLQRPPVKTVSPLPSPIPPPIDIAKANGDDDEDDDDDWGEMVSSPTAAESGVASFSVDGEGFDVAGSAVPASLDGVIANVFNGDDNTKLPPNQTSHKARGLKHLELNGTLNLTLSTPPMSPSFTPGSSKPAIVSPDKPINTTPTITSEPSVAMPEAITSDEDIIAGILQHLPDLSYMLR